MFKMDKQNTSSIIFERKKGINRPNTKIMPTQIVDDDDGKDDIRLTQMTENINKRRSSRSKKISTTY